MTGKLKYYNSQLNYTGTIGSAIRTMGEDLRRENGKVGLSINWGKTKILSNIQDLGEIEISGQK